MVPLHGRYSSKAVEHAVVLEECAGMAWQDLLVSNNTVRPIQKSCWIGTTCVSMDRMPTMDKQYNMGSKVSW